MDRHGRKKKFRKTNLLKMMHVQCQLKLSEYQKKDLKYLVFKLSKVYLIAIVVFILWYINMINNDN